MASLKVISAPTNQPTLNPKVQSAPVQPTLAPKVAIQPRQPTLAPKVVTQPVQPSFSPVVQSQPANQQASLLVSYGKVIDSIVAAKARGADSQTILQEIITQNQDKQPVFQEAMSRGATPEQILDKIIQDNYIPSGQETEPEGEKGIKGFGLGVAKGMLSTASNLTGLARKASSKIPNTLMAIPGIAPLAQLVKAGGEADKKLEPYKQNFKPQGTAEKIGFGTEQVAEFFIPAGGTAKAVKAAEAGINTLKAGKAATSALKLGSKVAIGAGEAAGVTALQGGSKEEVKTAAVLGGAFSAVSKGIEKLLENAPKTAWSSILKRTPTEAAKNPDLPAQAAKTGLSGASRTSILNKAQQQIQNIEVALDDLLSQSTGKIGTLKIAPYLDELRNAYKNVPGEQTSLEAIDNVMRDLLKRKSLTLPEANELKRSIYGAIAKSYGKGMLELPAKTEAQKLIAAGLKREIEKVVPEVKSLNEQQAVYIQVKKAIEKALARTEGKGIGGTGIGLYDLLVGGIGTGAGVATGNPLLGLGLVAAKKTVESTAILSGTTKLINYFNRLSPTKKLLFYNALKGLTVKGGVGITNATSRQTAR